MTEEGSNEGYQQMYEALNELFIGRPTDEVLTMVGQFLVDVFTDDILPNSGEANTDKEFRMYLHWLKQMYEVNKPTNQSGVLH